MVVALSHRGRGDATARAWSGATSGASRARRSCSPAIRRVPLNTCYVARCRDARDAFALAALLNGPLARAWLDALAEPARGGYRRYLGWTMSLLPVPSDWNRARDILASLGEAGARGEAPSDQELLDAALAAYGAERREYAAHRRVGRHVSGFRRASADDVRRLIATTMLGEGPAAVASDALGRIELRPHQIDAAERLVAMIERHGGAMLAEPVGVGKTYTALAVAVRLGATRVVVAAPASLREMWTAAMRECEREAVLITHEALSRGAAPEVDPDLVIVDESHRVRNPATRRYASLAALCARSRVLLVTATPVQNARVDLAAQLALYLGRAAWSLSDTEIADSRRARRAGGRREWLARHAAPLRSARRIA